MATYKSRVSSLAKRFLNFLKIFLRNKRGLAGITIIIFFALMAFVGPLTSPYNPTEDIMLANRRAAPIWLKSLPSALGGNPDLTENLNPIKDPGFKNPVEYVKTTDLTGTIGEWKFSKNHTSISNPEYDPNVGFPTIYPDGSGPGSLKLTFSRKTTDTTYGHVVAYLNKTFYWPYKNRPQLFYGLVALLMNGTTITFKGNQILRIPVYISYFIQAEGGKMEKIWPLTLLKIFDPNYSRGMIPVWESYTTEPFLKSSATDWIVPLDSPRSQFRGATEISSDAGEVKIYYGKLYNALPTTIIFPTTPGNYTVGLEIIFEDTPMPTTQEYRYYQEPHLQNYTNWYDLRMAQQNWNHPVEVTIHIDDTRLLFLGDSFGLLGTDYRGRDIYTQLVYGAGISLYVGLLASIFGVVIGLVVGLAAGYLGKLVDEALMRFSDLLLVLPSLPLLIVLMAVLGPTIDNLIILIGLLGWMGFAKLVRAQVLSLRERPFVEAAKAVGAGNTHIIVKHILPNVMALVYVTLATTVPGAIVAEAALSWLGLFDPRRMSWGRMLYDAFNNEGREMWWWILPPGLCIAAVAVSFVLLGYALDDVLNPKLRVRK
jgi:ABC-type dipeptide/oligopeptide/nickel transport system permease subunit